MIRAGLIAALLLLASGPAPAQDDPVAVAEQAARLVSAASDLLAAARNAEDALAAYGQAVQAHEAGLDALREGMRGLAARSADLRARMAEKREVLAGVLGILLSAERIPVPARLVHPGGPVGAARAAMLMGDISPALDQELIALQAALSELERLQVAQDVAGLALRDGLQGLQAARLELATALSRHRPGALPDPSEVARLRDGAATLRAFADALATLGPGAGTVPDFAALRGSLPLPVAGRLLRRFGEADAAGLARPGLVLEADPHALVTAPARATLRYAGPFLDYGEIAILEPRQGWLIVLAGLGRIDRRTGEVLEAGEPIGVLGGLQPDAEEFLIDESVAPRTIRSETLYVELRQDGEPVDPTLWFRFTPAKEGSR